MRFRSYNSEFLIAQALISNIFNDIVIDRRAYDHTRDYLEDPLDLSTIVQKKIEVPCIYGDRSIILRSLENENASLKLPLFILESNTIKVDTNRQVDLHVDVFYQADSSFSKLDKTHPLYRPPIDLNKRRGLPVNIDYTLTLVSRYKEDLDQMLTNWMVHMRPDVYVRWWHPRNKIKPIESEILWDGSINMDKNAEYDPTTRFQWKATANFTFKTWIFPGLNDKNSFKNDGKDLIEYFNVFPMSSYDEWGGDKSYLDENLSGFPVFGDIYNRENAGFFAVDTFQEFYNDGSDPSGILKGKYAINNIESKPDSIFYDETSGILLSGQTVIKNITLVGDIPTNIALNKSYPSIKMWKDCVIPDPVNNECVAFKYVYFRGADTKNKLLSYPPSGDILFRAFFNSTEDEPLLFGSSYTSPIFPKYYYEIDHKKLTIECALNNDDFNMLIQSDISSFNGISEYVKLENKYNEYPVKLYWKRSTDMNFYLDSKQSAEEFIGINLWTIDNKEQVKFNIECTDYQNKLRNLRDSISASWAELSLQQLITDESRYKLSGNTQLFSSLAKHLNTNNRILTNFSKKSVENLPPEYSLIMNKYLYFVLNNDEIYDWGVVDIPKFNIYNAPIFNVTYPNNMLSYGFCLDYNI